MNTVISTIIIVLLVLAGLQLFGGLGNQIIGVFEMILLIGIVVMVIMWLSAYGRRASYNLKGAARRRRKIEREVEEEADYDEV